MQQTSDLTYRVFDWNRPATPGRVLHIEKSLAVTDPSASAPAQPVPALAAGERAELVACPYFTLELIVGGEEPLAGDTAGRTFHALTVIDGAAEVVAQDGALRLNRFDSAIIPAACARLSDQATGRLPRAQGERRLTREATARRRLPNEFGV